MSDYVKRSDVINSVCQFCKDQHADELCDQWDVCQLFTRISNVPSADVVERKRGKWITHSAAYEYCSECENIFSISSLFLVGGNDEPKYCPNCGADMRGAE